MKNTKAAQNKHVRRRQVRTTQKQHLYLEHLTLKKNWYIKPLKKTVPPRFWGQTIVGINAMLFY